MTWGECNQLILDAWAANHYGQCALHPIDGDDWQAADEVCRQFAKTGKFSRSDARVWMLVNNRIYWAHQEYQKHDPRDEIEPGGTKGDLLLRLLTLGGSKYPPASYD